MKKAMISGICISLFLCVLILFLYPSLPSQIPIHWGVNGIDAYGDRNAVFQYPFILFLLNAVLIIAIKADPKKRNIQKSKKAYAGFLWLMNISMTILFLSMLYAIYYPNAINMDFFGQFFMGIVIGGLGNLMPRIRQNYFVGIKTPWVLEDERVWSRTHRFSGRLWFFAGIFLVVTAFLPVHVLPLNIMILAAIAVVPFLYSYLIYKKLHEKEKTYD